MSLKNPKKFWASVSKQYNWLDYILPRNNLKEFYREGFLEAQRLYYFYDKNSTVIDYGCGIGRIIKSIYKDCEKAIGLDINKDFIIKAKKDTKANNLEFHTIDEYRTNEIADFIYCFMVMQHNDSKNRNKIINNIFNLLKNGGQVIIQFPNNFSDYYQESDFVHKFSLNEIKEYGKNFKSHKIIEGNLINYAKRVNVTINHEYFLIAKK